jgi:hypothetical protein
MLMSEAQASHTDELVATGDDGLALVRSSMTSTDRAAGTSYVEWLAVIELDGDGLRTTTDVFDADDIDGAMAHLSERILARGTTAGHVRWIMAGRAFAARDWVELATHYAPDLVVEDHRPARLGRVESRDEWFQLYHTLVEEAPDAHGLRYHFVDAGRVNLAVGGIVGTTDAGPFENLAISVLERDAEGRVSRWDMYDLEQVATARAEFDARVAARAAVSTNAAIRRMEALNHAWRRGDWDAIVALHHRGYADDRRPLVRHRMEPDDVLAYLRDGFEAGAQWSFEVIATRGDRLALVHSTVATPENYVGPAEWSRLLLAKVDGLGRGIVTVLFDTADEGGAFDELDRRYLEGEAAPHAATLRIIRDVVRARQEGDWAGWRAAFDEDFVLIDRRRGLGFRTVSVEEFLADPIPIGDIVDTARSRIEHVLGLSDHSGLVVVRVSGSVGGGGGAFESRWLTVFTHDGAHIRSFERFDETDVDAARARYRELAGREAAPDGRFTNAAVRNMDGFLRAWKARDWDGVTACYLEGTVLDDRRSFVQLRSDAEGSAASLRMGMRSGNTYTAELVATRGERLALFRSVVGVPDGSPGGPAEIERLLLAEVDGEGLRTETVFFDLDDLDAAHDELDARYAAGEAAAFATRIARFREAAVDRRVFGSARTAPDFVLIDHRTFGYPPMGRDEVAAHHVDEMLGLAPDVRWRLEHLRVCARATLLVTTTRGNTVEGVEFETPIVHVVEHTPSEHLARWDTYDLDQIELARKRFAELGTF